MIKKIFKLFMLTSISLCLSSCGYTTRSMVSNEFQTIHVEPFVNKIDLTRETDALSKYKLYRPLLETDITQAVVSKYLFDGNLKPIQKGEADLTLKGELIDFRKDPLRYLENSNDVEEYRVSIAVNLSLWNNKTQKLVWQESGFTGQYSYFVTGPQALPEATAITNAINDLVRRIVERTVEQW